VERCGLRVEVRQGFQRVAEEVQPGRVPPDVGGKNIDDTAANARLAGSRTVLGPHVAVNRKGILSGPSG